MTYKNENHRKAVEEYIEGNLIPYFTGEMPLSYDRDRGACVYKLRPGVMCSVGQSLDWRKKVSHKINNENNPVSIILYSGCQKLSVAQLNIAKKVWDSMQSLHDYVADDVSYKLNRERTMLIFNNLQHVSELRLKKLESAIKNSKYA